MELCESLQSDLLQDSHPALLLPLHWCESRWKQQRNGRGKSPGDVQVPSNKPGDDAEVQLAVESVSSTPCLLYSLTVTLERHVDPERDVSPAVVLAVLQAQIVLLGRLREVSNTCGDAKGTNVQDGTSIMLGKHFLLPIPVYPFHTHGHCPMGCSCI